MARGDASRGTHGLLARRTLLQGSAAIAVAALGPVARPTRPDDRGTLGRPALRRPNVLMISFDDLGWNGLGCCGNDFVETPHIDRLAAGGMRFTQSYAAAPVCSPTRAALMTGLFPARTGITTFLRDELAPGDHYLAPRFRTVPEYLARLGYRSVLIGKWHLTEDYSGPYRLRRGNPFVQGFDDVLLSEEKYIGSGDMWYPYRFMPSVPPGRSSYLTDRIADAATAWIARHADTPFFAHVSNYAIHKDWSAPADLVEKYERKKRLHPEFEGNAYVPLVAAMVERCDVEVGRIVRALDDAGIAGNTLLLVTSDNGGCVRPSNRPLRAGKGSLHEGGIRVPLLACWPGTVPAGTTSDAVVTSLDLLPTVKELVGVTGGPVLDGVSLLGALLRREPLVRDAYWYFPHSFAPDGVPSAAIRSGRHKLFEELRTGALELYDLLDDPGEHTNLVDDEPLVTARLHRLLRRHVREMRAAVDRAA